MKPKKTKKLGLKKTTVRALAAKDLRNIVGGTLLPVGGTRIGCDPIAGVIG